MNARMTRTLGALSMMLCAQTARAADGELLTVNGRGDHVEILARGATVKEGTRAAGRAIWIDVNLDGPPRAVGRLVVPNDRTIKKVEVVGGQEWPHLSILLHHDMSGSEFATNTVIEQSLAGVVVRIPREPDKRPIPYVAPIEGPEYGPQPEPRASLPPAPARSAVAMVAGERPSPAISRAARSAAPSTAPAAAPVSPSAPPAAALPLAAAPIADALALADEGGPGAGHTPIFLSILLLSAAGIATILLARRRRGDALPQQLLRVVSSCQLSPKVRIVLVTVGDRELLLSVGDGGATVLGRWRPGQRSERVTLELGAEERAEEARTVEDGLGKVALARETAEIPDIDLELETAGGPHAAAPALSRAPSAAPARPSPSPAVAGLLKLRRRGGEEVASGDPVADELWARELLAAMRGSPEVIR